MRRVTARYSRWWALAGDAADLGVPSSPLEVGVLALAVAVWVCSGVLGFVVASGKGRAGSGFVLGLLFGPLGVLVAFAIAPSAPAKEREIRERLITEARVRGELGLSGGTASTEAASRVETDEEHKKRAATERNVFFFLIVVTAAFALRMWLVNHP